MKKTLIVIIPILISCGASMSSKRKCNENENFKELFFYHVDYIRTHISVSQDKKFRESVIFISNYAPVSIDRIMNYARTYPTGVFEEDEEKWLLWYEENKCKNIQLKTVYIIPEAYKE